MVDYKKFILDNGLKVIVHEDRSTPLVAMNTLYDVGSRDEDPGMTGMAHILEHLMFGGSVNIRDYDLPLQIAGGENNAYTNNDITNYYITIPSDNIETAFWLESDRMVGLNFSRKNFDTQKNVVIEEFKQRYLNKPYGDAIHLLRALAYNIHPYRWPTIGMDISHIENTDLEDVKKFFYSHYSPNNAILTLAGNITYDIAYKLSQKWFGPIEKRNIQIRDLPVEPAQNGERRQSFEKDVPATALYKVWHIGPRDDIDYYTLDLITDILAGGESGRLHTKLVREKKLFSEINAFITADIDPGLAIIQGKLMRGVNILQAEDSVNEIIRSLKEPKGLEDEMEKVKNKYESSTVFANTSILNKANNLSFNELIGNSDLINMEVELYRNVSQEMVIEAARKYFTSSNCSTIYYKSTREES